MGNITFGWTTIHESPVSTRPIGFAVLHSVWQGGKKRRQNRRLISYQKQFKMNMNPLHYCPCHNTYNPRSICQWLSLHIWAVPQNSRSIQDSAKHRYNRRLGESLLQTNVVRCLCSRVDFVAYDSAPSQRKKKERKIYDHSCHVNHTCSASPPPARCLDHLIQTLQILNKLVFNKMLRLVRNSGWWQKNWTRYYYYYCSSTWQGFPIRRGQGYSAPAVSMVTAR